MDELASRRWDKAAFASEISPRDARQKCLSQIENEDIQSVFIICVDSKGLNWSYSGGPDVDTISQVWGVLQRQVLRIIERIVGNATS